jgi:hypothetical protein
MSLAYAGSMPRATATHRVTGTNALFITFDGPGGDMNGKAALNGKGIRIP